MLVTLEAVGDIALDAGREERWRAREVLRSVDCSSSGLVWILEKLDREVGARDLIIRSPFPLHDAQPQ